MRCRKRRGAERATGQAGEIVCARREWPFRWTPARVHWPLWLLFIGLQIADVVTTNYALAIPGNWEANPIMELSQSQFGAAWWLPKVAVVGFAAVVVARACRLWPMVLTIFYYLFVVSANLACL
jgi:hypothetical protein